MVNLNKKEENEMSEYDHHKLDGTQKTILGGLTIFAVFVIALIVWSDIRDATRINMGLQECKYAVPGVAGMVSSWMRECPKNAISSDIVEEQTSQPQ